MYIGPNSFKLKRNYLFGHFVCILRQEILSLFFGFWSRRCRLSLCHSLCRLFTFLYPTVIDESVKAIFNFMSDLTSQILNLVLVFVDSQAQLNNSSWKKEWKLGEYVKRWNSNQFTYKKEDSNPIANKFLRILILNPGQELNWVPSVIWRIFGIFHIIF